MSVAYVSEGVFATRSYLEMEITLSQDQISKYADKILLYSNTCVKELRRLFLVQDLVDSLKVCLTQSPFCIRLDIHRRYTQVLLYETRLGKVCSSYPAIKVATCWQRDAKMCLCVPVCCLDVAPDLRGRSLQRPDTAHSR